MSQLFYIIYLTTMSLENQSYPSQLDAVKPAEQLKTEEELLQEQAKKQDVMKSIKEAEFKAKQAEINGKVEMALQIWDYNEVIKDLLQTNLLKQDNIAINPTKPHNQLGKIIGAPITMAINAIGDRREENKALRNASIATLEELLEATKNFNMTAFEQELKSDGNLSTTLGKNLTDLTEKIQTTIELKKDNSVAAALELGNYDKALNDLLTTDLYDDKQANLQLTSQGKAIVKLSIWTAFKDIREEKRALKNATPEQLQGLLNAIQNFKLKDFENAINTDDKTSTTLGTSINKLEKRITKILKKRNSDS